MAYSPTNWGAGQSITADLMNKIEQGIKNAVDDSSNAKSAAQSASDTVQGFSDTLNDHSDRLDALETADENNDNRIQQGVDAWTQVRPTLTFNGQNITRTLNKRLQDDEDAIDKIRVNVEGAKRNNQDSLSKRFNDLDDTIDLINGDISTINETFRNAAGGSYSDIQSRFNADENAIDDLDDRLDPIEAQLQKALADRNYTGSTALDDRFKASEDKLSAALDSDAYGSTNNPRHFTSIDARMENVESEVVTARTSSAYGSNSNNPVTYTSLDARFEATESEIKAGRGGNDSLSAHFSSLDNAKVNYADIFNGVNYTGDAQKKALDAKQGKALNDRITTAISNYESADTGLSERISTLETNVNGAKITGGAQTLDKRFDDIDGGSKPDRTLPNVIDELETAHVSGVIKTAGGQDTSYDSIDARMAAIENYAVWTRGKVTDAFSSHENAVNGVDANYNDLDERFEYDENKINAINGKLGNGFASTQGNTVSEKIIAAEQSAKDYADAKFGTGVNTGNNQTNGTVTAQMTSVRSRLEDIENELSAAHVTGANSLDDRFDAIDGGSKAGRTLPNLVSEVETARGTSDNLNARLDDIDTTTTGLDARLDKIDGGEALTGDNLVTRVSNLENEINAANGDRTLDDRFDAIETNISTIANELAMVDGTNIVDTNTRVDTLESDLRTMAAELNMLDGTAIIDTNTRIDTIDADLNTATTGIKARLDAIDNTSTGALKSVDNRLDAIDGGEALSTTNGTLGARVASIESNLNDASSGLAAVKSIADRADAAAAQANEKIGTNFGSGNTVRDAIDSINNTKANKTEVSLTIVLDRSQVNYDNSGNPLTLKTGEIVDRNDYLIQENKENGKYYYWKHINNEWQLMGGAGTGTGSSSGMFAASLSEIVTPDLNTDYFVGNNTSGYLHYRYIIINESPRPVLIGADPTNIKRYNMMKHYNDTDQKNYLDLYEFDYGTGNLIDDELMQPIAHIELPEGGGGGSAASMTRVVRITPASVVTVQNDEKIYLRFFYSSVDETGESHEADYVLKYNNGSVIKDGKLNSGSNDQSVTTGVWPAEPRPVGFYEIDVTDYCRLGTQTFNLYVTPEGNTSAIPRSWTIEIKELRLTSDALISQVIELGDSIQFPYTPYGAMTKTLHVLVDNTEIGTYNIGAAISGSELEYTIPSPVTAGAHSISIYLSANLNGENLTTTPITRDYIWYNAEAEDVIILASPYRYATLSAITSWPAWTANHEYAVGDQVKITNASGTIGYVCKIANNDSTFNTENWTAQVINAQQYEEIEIPYTIYNSNSNTSTVEYYDGNKLIDTVSVTDGGILRYASEDFGNRVLKIKVADAVLEFNVVLSEMQIDIAQVGSYVINFDPSTLSNSSANRLQTWTYNNQTYHMTVSDNFNWSDDPSGGGYKEDEDGKCFVVKAGTWVEFDYKMFKQVIDNTDPENPVISSSAFDKGAEMKVTFKVTAVRDASAVWFSNVGNPSEGSDMPLGIQLSAHQGWLKTSAADAAEKQAQLTGEAVSTNSYLYFPYSEEDKIELDININKSGRGEDFIMSYEDGVPSKAYAYETSEILYHADGAEAPIHIGSPDCDIHIYKFRIYDKGLTTSEILRNFIADGKTITEKVNRYDRNSIYYDSTKAEGYRFTPYKTGSAILDPQQLAKKMPNVKILMLEAPTFTKSKNTFVKSSLRCIHAEGGEYYPSRGDEDNWFFYDGYHSGQGTTSDNYGQASRNVDFLFMSDGVNAPTKKKNITGYEGYVSKLIKGVNESVFNPTTKSWTPAVGAEPVYCINWKDHDNWKANTEYAVGARVLYNKRAYQCVTAHTSSENFEAVNWEFLGNDYSCKVALTSTSIPNNYFNLKVNVASSENVNNALFQKRYNDFLPYVYQTPAYKRDSRIKNDMEFVPAILFVRETDTTQDENNNYTSHLEFNDTEWHFYSLGNIGDSKKTDYTRAYDPDDMNEFTVEISDNNTSNSQFQSGVYISNNERVVEENDSGINSMNYIWDITDEEWNAQRDPTAREIEHDQQVAAKASKYLDGTDLENAKTSYILPNGKVYVNYRHRMLSGDPFDGKHSFEFRYACCGDYRDGDLINKTPGQDDDAQFDINRAVLEAFYEWIITSSNDEFKNELAEWCVPEAVEFFYAYTHFYTMMDNRAKNCFWHFGKTGTHRQVHHAYKQLLHVYDELINGEYVRTQDTELDPEKTYYTEYAFDLWVYDTDTAAGIDNNGELIFPYGKEDTDYRIAGVSTSGYVFNGAGSIIWRRLSSSFTDEIADIFNRVNEAACFDATNLINEFDRFQSCYPEEMWRLDIERKYIRTFTGKVYDNCKTTDDGGNTKQNTRFLKEMMQGRKKYQRRQWVRDQAIYFGSKYMLNNVRNNTIEMVCYTPDAPLWNSRGYEYKENDITYYRPFQAGDYVFYGSENNRKLYKCITANSDTTFITSKWAEGVTPNYKLKITPYQDMYINVAVGNGNLRSPVRAIAGEEYEIDCTANMNETRVYIYAGSYIQAISNLAPFYIGANIFSSAAHLKKLDLGTDNSTYHNTNLKGLTLLANMPILEELNIKNCDSLNTPINLSESNNLRIVEAEGSMIPSLSLPQYTKIEILHLPSSVNVLSLQSARALTSFYMKNRNGVEDYSNLLNMNITDSDYSNNINWMSIATAALPHLNTLYLQNLSVAHIADIYTMDDFVSRKRAIETQYDDYGNLINKLNLSGIIHVTNDWSTVEKDEYESVWPNLTFDVSQGHEQTKHKVIYKYDDYIDDDGQLIYGQEIKTLYVNHGDPIPDIWEYTNDNDEVIHMISEMPHRDSSVEHHYQFGERESSIYYIPLSGWKYAGETVPLSSYGSTPLATNDGSNNEGIIIETYFKLLPHTYPVKWYLYRNNVNSLIATSDNEVSYGGGYDLIAPTVQDIHNAGWATATVTVSGGTASYSIFDGWEKLPTNINPTKNDAAFNIYANWHSGEIALIDLYTANDTLSEEDRLLVLSALDNNAKSTYQINNKVAISSRVDFDLGQDSIKPGTTLVSPNAVLRTDLSSFTGRRTDIQPFKEGDNAFTIVIDYSFKENATYDSTKNSAILASCYYQNNTNNTLTGFALYYNLNTNSGAAIGPRIGFGDMFNRGNLYSKPVGSPNNLGARNVIVLRHPKDSETIYIYSGLNYNDSMPEEVYVDQITWNDLTTDAYLNFGRLTNSTDSDYNSLKLTMEKAQGTIYWAKYWNEDLGVGECMRLAAWPHEKITYAISSLTPGRTSDNRISNATPSIYLTSLETSAHGKVVQRGSNNADDVRGWGDSSAETICNNRVLRGLPTRLQSILCKPAVIYRTASPTDSASGITQYKLDANSSITYDYVFMSSVSNLSTTDTDYQIEESQTTLARPYQWLSDANSVKVYKYVAGGSWTEISEDKSAYYNLRFNYQPISWSSISGSELRIFKEVETTLPSNTSIITAINKISGGIKVGDIFIPAGGEGIAYIYISSDDINLYGAQAMPNSGSFATDAGGWVPSTDYWTRSQSAGNYNSSFCYVTKLGVVTKTNNNSASATGLSLNYTISI